MTTSRKGAVRSGLLDASRHGTDVLLLRRLRNRISEMLDDPQISPRDFGTLSRRLLDTNKDLREAELAGEPLSQILPVPDEPFRYEDI